MVETLLNLLYARHHYLEKIIVDYVPSTVTHKTILTIYATCLEGDSKTEIVPPNPSMVGKMSNTQWPHQKNISVPKYI